MNKNLITLLAHLCQRINNALSNSDDIALEYERLLERLEARVLPKGSGMDTGVKVNVQKSGLHRLVLEFEYHAMDEDGYYFGWYPYTVTVLPTLNRMGYTLNIRGRNTGKLYGTKECLEETFDHLLSLPVLSPQPYQMVPYSQGVDCPLSFKSCANCAFYKLEPRNIYSTPEVNDGLPCIHLQRSCSKGCEFVMHPSEQDGANTK